MFIEIGNEMFLGLRRPEMSCVNCKKLKKLVVYRFTEAGYELFLGLQRQDMSCV